MKAEISKRVDLAVPWKGEPKGRSYDVIESQEGKYFYIMTVSYAKNDGLLIRQHMY